MRDRAADAVAADGSSAVGTGPDAGGAMLEVRGLSRRYSGADVAAVDDVDLSVAAGEIFAVVGESGAGKSTLLRLIAGLEVPEAGTIRLAGRSVSAPDAWIPPEDRPLGMLFQEGALFPHLDVADNVEFGLRGMDRGARRRRRGEVLRLVGLPGYGDRYPHQLSGGERRRVALARAVAPDPDLVLLDEPFTGLDANLTRRLRDELGRILRETDTTALIVLHDTDEVLPLADRIGVLRRGRLEQVGSPDDVYARPCSEYVARLFGPVNVLGARRRGRELESPVGTVPTAPGRAAGERALVCYRPEDLEVGAAGRFTAEGRIVASGYRGDRLELTVRIPAAGEGETEVRVHAGTDDGDAASLDPGSRVSLRSRPGRGHVLRDAGGGPGENGDE